MKIERLDTFAGHRGAIYALSSGLEPYYIYSAGSDGWVVQWNLQKPDLGKVVAQISGSVFAMAFDAASGILWVGQNFEGIHGILVSDQSRVFSIQLPSLSIYAIEIVDGQVWLGHQDGLITVVDQETQAVKKRIKAGESNVRSFCPLPNGTIAVGASDGFIRIFDLAFNLNHAWRAHQTTVFSMVYQSESATLVSAGRDAYLKKWNLAGELQGEAVPAHIYSINTLVQSPCGSYLATGSMDKTIKIWDAGTLRLMKVLDYARYGGHKNSINRLIWSAFEDLLVSASDDKNISVWKID